MPHSPMMTEAYPRLVMAGRDPAIHAFRSAAASGGNFVDARIKSGHDAYLEER